MQLRKLLGYVSVVTCAALALAASAVSADDKKDDKAKPALAGTWAKKDGELKLEFNDKGVLKIMPHGNDAVVVVCRYTAEKAGRVKAKVTGFEGEEDVQQKLKELVPVGLEFRFKYEAKGDAAKLADVTGDKTEALKAHLEGDYERKK